MVRIYYTTDLDCLLREPLDLMEPCVCKEVAWLGEDDADCGHLSAAQSADTQKHVFLA